MKIWITKYALTEGIREAEAERCLQVDPNMVEVVGLPLELYHKGQWWPTEAEARNDAERRRLAKITSLRKQIVKLEKRSFV